MNLDAIRAFFTYIIAILILAGGFYSLVLNQFVLDDLSKGAVIGFMGAVVQFVFGAEIAKAAVNATMKSLMTPPPTTDTPSLPPPTP